MNRCQFRWPERLRPRLLSLLPVLLLLSCSTGPPSTGGGHGSADEVRRRLAPELIRVRESARRFDVTWSVRRRRQDAIRGYNIYVSRQPGLAKLAADDPELARRLYNPTPYPGDTDGDIHRETFTVEDVKTGVHYYVHVRTVLADGQLSFPSTEMDVVPRPHGRMTLYPRFSGREDGFSFQGDGPVPGTDEANDLYLFHGAGGSYLASPSRLDRGLRRTLFFDLGKSESIEDYPVFDGRETGAEKVLIRIGHSIGLRLADDRLAKVRPVEMIGDGDSVRVVLEYIYQPLRGVNRF